MDWTRGPTLGRGSTATVYLAKAFPPSGHMFAVKSAKLHQSEPLRKEQRILSTLQMCPQIVAYKGCDVTLENGVLFYNLFMEYAPHGTLADAARRRGGLDEVVVRTYARQILLGLNHLHSNGIVHCDIKGKNVLVTEDGAKIADLGCAREAADCGGVIAGTPAFMAPEVARGEQQGYPADVWSLGCTVLEMITGRAPWPELSDPVNAVYRIGFSDDVPEIPGLMSEEGRDFVSKCLKREPNERWSVGELLRHGFVEESTLITKEYESSSSDTPTSVMDRTVWKSFQTTQDPTGECSWNSARHRIRQLFVNSTTSFRPSWEIDENENWITVRGSRIIECVVKTETCGSDIVYINVRKQESSVLSDEPRTLTSIGKGGLNLDYSCSCVKINVVHKGKIKYQNEETSLMFCFYTSLTLFCLSTAIIGYNGFTCAQYND